MKKIILEVYAFIASISALFVYIYRFSLRGTLNPMIKDEKIGQNIVLLGNGPSVNDAIIDLLTTNSVYAVVNFFALSKYYQRLRPRYYILSDGAFCCELSFNTMIADLIEHINETTKWKMSLYIPYRSIKGSNIAKMFTNPLIEVHFYNDIPYEGKYVIPALRDYLYRKGLANIDIWNVIQAGIMLLILLGYKTIHLYGVENSEPNSLKVNEKNQAGYIHELFYDKSQSNMELILNEDGSPMKVCQILFRYYKTFQGFMDVNHFAKKQNCRVINHTTASLIDAFERV